MPEPVLTEHVEDSLGGFEQQWMIEPPAEGVSYRVTKQEWNDDYSVRTILELATDATE